MTEIKATRTVRIEAARPEWKGFYKVAAVTISLSVFLMVLDIVSTILLRETAMFSGFSATEWFTIFRNSWFSGLRNLGLLNVFELALSIPMFFALFATHQHTDKALAALAGILGLAGAAVYISNNAAVPMLVLSGKYAAVSTDAQRSLLAAAGEAILARGEDFAPGSYTGFLLGETANLILAFVMLRGKVFGKTTAWIGMSGIGLLSVYTAWVTFIPSGQGIAMVVAMIGGTLSTAWYVLIARKLFRLCKQNLPEV